MSVNLVPGIYAGQPQAMLVGELDTDKQTPFIQVTWQVTHYRPSPNGEWQKIAPQTATTRWFLSDNSWQYTENKLVKIGFNGQFDSPQCDYTKAHELCFEIKQRGDKQYPDWDLAPAGREVKKCADQRLRVFNSRWSNAHAPAPQPAPSDQTTAVHVQGGGDEHDYDSAPW